MQSGRKQSRKCENRRRNQKTFPPTCSCYQYAKTEY